MINFKLQQTCHSLIEEITKGENNEESASRY